MRELQASIALLLLLSPSYLGEGRKQHCHVGDIACKSFAYKSWKCSWDLRPLLTQTGSKPSHWAKAIDKRKVLTWQACNSCYYFTGNDKNCPRCRRNQGAQAARKRTVVSEAAVAGAATSTMRIVSVESLADEQQAQTPPAKGQPLSLSLPPPSLGDAQVTEQEQAGAVVEELPQEPGADVVILDEVDEPATSDGQPIVEEPEVPVIGAITEGEKVELVSGDSLQSNPDQLIMDC